MMACFNCLDPFSPHQLLKKKTTQKRHSHVFIPSLLFFQFLYQNDEDNLSRLFPIRVHVLLTHIDHDGRLYYPFYLY